MSSQSTRRRWNHNIHFHHLVLDAVPPGARSALDVGTGNGPLAADLRGVVPLVTAIDCEASTLDSARRESTEVEWIHGDVLEYPFEPESFDVVASVGTVHHLPDLRGCLHRPDRLAAGAPLRRGPRDRS